jgi:hypothetical protein
MFVVLLVLAPGLLVACKSDPVAEGGACKEASECAPGLQCRAGVCAKPQLVAPAPEPAAPGLAQPIRDAKGSEKTAQDGLDKRAEETFKEAQEQ